MTEIRVQVAWSGPQGQGEVVLQLLPPVTVEGAIARAREQAPDLIPAAEDITATGVWGKKRGAEFLLRAGDRVELYRALKADPKDARRSNAERAPHKTKKM